MDDSNLLISNISIARGRAKPKESGNSDIFHFRADQRDQCFNICPFQKCVCHIFICNIFKKFQMKLNDLY